MRLDSQRVRGSYHVGFSPRGLYFRRFYLGILAFVYYPEKLSDEFNDISNSKASIHSIHSKKKNSLQWRHNEHDGVSNHQLYDCLLNRLFRRRSKTISKLRVTGLCVGNSPVTGPVMRKMFPLSCFKRILSIILLKWKHFCFPPIPATLHFS